MTMSFRTIGGTRLRGTVSNPKASIGALAQQAARKLGLAGSFQILDPASQDVLRPDTPLNELDTEEVVLASELTPA
jgi:hypothetical protein